VTRIVKISVHIRSDFSFSDVVVDSWFWHIAGSAVVSTSTEFRIVFDFGRATNPLIMNLKAFCHGIYLDPEIGLKVGSTAHKLEF
jgi:hypothetical protein